MKKEPFLKAKPIIETLETAGYEAFFVGGCVRDLLIDREIKDIDIATSAPPEAVSQLFDKVIPVGIAHGTVIVRLDGISYEITTFRSEEGYSDRRRPDHVQFIQQIDEDLKRRDFTINALAMTKEGEIIDLFEGKKDLTNRLIRTVGNAYDRFMEDPLRMIRAVRFSSQLGFAIEDNTLYYMKDLKEEIETIAIERLLNEITQFFQGEYIGSSFHYVIDTGIYRHLPVFKNKPNIIHIFPKNLSSFESFSEIIAMLHYLDNQIPIEEWAKSWKCANKIKRDAINLYESIIQFKKNGISNWLVYRLDQNNYKAFIHVTDTLNLSSQISLDELTAYSNQLPIHTRSEIQFDGHELQTMFPNREKGPWMKEYISKIEYAIVMNELENDYKQIKEWILCHPPEVN